MAKTPTKKMKNRALALMAMLFAAVCVIIGFLVYYQIINYDVYQSKAIAQQTMNTTINAKRGSITDCNGVELAVSSDVKTVYISPKNIDDEDAHDVAKNLSEILGVDYDTVYEKTQKNNYYEIVKRKIESDVADKVRQYISESKATGIHLIDDTKRYYPYNNLASHIIGFVGEDNQGLEGIESIYDDSLSGVPGRVVTTRDTAGIESGTDYESYIEAQDGYSVVLTIDETIQSYVEKHLENARIANKLEEGAAAIVMDVNTAEILAMATKPDYDLNIMKQGQDLTDVTARVLTGLRDVFKECRPDIVLVHGDTTTSMAGALAAFYAQIPVGHVEAGLRTHNIYSPWPEEMNRQITGRIASYNFAPTPLSEKNLIEEKAQGNIYVTGNTVIDALHLVVDKLSNDPSLSAEQDRILKEAGYDITRLVDGKKLVLITGHRRENFGDGFIRMVTAMKDLSEKYPNVDFVYPMHLNPNVRKPIHEVFGEDLTLPNFFFIEPLQYLEFVHLMNKATIVLTDSGGIQEEAPGLGKPVLVMRDTTERPEALESGTVHLVGTNYDKIVNEVSTLLDDSKAYEKMSKAVNPYGDGRACMRIVDIIAKIWQFSDSF